LSAIEQGDPSAAEQLLPLVYEEVRKLAAQKMANEKSGGPQESTNCNGFRNNRERKAPFFLPIP